MILLCGIPSEASLSLVADALDNRNARWTMVNQRHIRDLSIRVAVDSTGLSGRLTSPAGDIDLNSVRGVYLRCMDAEHLPELDGEPGDGPALSAARSFHEILGQWADLTPARVVNRYSAMGSNFSKPYQSQLIRRQGFSVPPTLVTNDPQLVRDFRATYGPLIYKSISGERSIVAKLEEDDDARLERVRWCPVQFQAFVGGPNVRVHTVGDQVFATIAHTDAVDYRYAVQQTGQPAVLQPFQLDDDLARRCVDLASSLGLAVAGLDLKFAPDGEIHCLEVNPSPAFSYYQLNTGQQIAEAIAGFLDGGTGSRPLKRLQAAVVRDRHAAGVSTRASR